MKGANGYPATVLARLADPYPSDGRGMCESAVMWGLTAVGVSGYKLPCDAPIAVAITTVIQARKLVTSWPDPFVPLKASRRQYLTHRLELLRRPFLCI